MAKKYTGSLSLEWFNKQKSILVQAEEAGAVNGDVPAPKMNWINKDDALFYEIVDDEGRGLSPYWVDRSDLRVKEARPLVFQKAYKAVEEPKSGSLLDKEYKLVESEEDDPTIENMLIRGDNLLALNGLKKLFANRPDEEKAKCIYTDLPYNETSSQEVCYILPKVCAMNATCWRVDRGLCHELVSLRIKSNVIVLRNADH